MPANKPRHLKAVFSSQDQAEARVAQVMLEANGFSVIPLDDLSSGSVAGFGPAIPVRLAVPGSQSEAALKILSGK